MLRNISMNAHSTHRIMGSKQPNGAFPSQPSQTCSCRLQPVIPTTGKIAWAFFLVLLMLAFGFPGPACAQPGNNETTVYVVGTGYIRGEDMSASRQEAIDNGLVMAVSRVLADLMPPELMAGSFQVLNEMVLSHTDKYVQDYKVLTESTISRTYRLLVQVTVSSRRLKDTLQKAGVRLGQAQYPRVLLCIAEKNIQDDAPRYWWGDRAAGEFIAGAALTKFFSDKGYVVVPPEAPTAGNYPPDLSAGEVVAIGQQMKADIVVTGLASAEETTSALGGTVRSYRATFNVTAYRVSDGSPIAQVLHTARGAAADAYSGNREVLSSVAVMVGEDLAPRIADAWFKQTLGTTQIDIVVQGVSGNIANFVKFRGALSNVSGVDSLQLKEMMSGAAVLTVTYQGNADTLADALLLLETGAFDVAIESVEGNTIRMKLLPVQKDQ